MPTKRGLDFSTNADDDNSPAPKDAAAESAGAAAPTSMLRGSGSAHMTTPMFSPLKTYSERSGSLVAPAPKQSFPDVGEYHSINPDEFATFVIECIDAASMKEKIDAITKDDGELHQTLYSGILQIASLLKIEINTAQKEDARQISTETI